MRVNEHPDEVVLKGGYANTGSVVRIGDEVARPSYPQTSTVNHFLAFLVNAGEPAVPAPRGTDDQGRQRLRYLAGTAPLAPFPVWAFDEQLLVDVARLQRRLHTLARSYEPPADAVWATSAGNYFPPSAFSTNDLLVCHNDLGMSNIVVDEQRRLSGVIDFDYCKPVDPLFDIAVAVRHWAPFGDLGLAPEVELDRVRRFGLYCDVHELSRSERLRVADLADDFLDHALTNIRTLAAEGSVGFQTLLETGYAETNKATRHWLAAHRSLLGSTTNRQTPTYP